MDVSKQELRDLMAEVAPIIREHVAQAHAPLGARVAALESAFAAYFKSEHARVRVPAGRQEGQTDDCG